jgi:hypothetical protein
MISKPLFLYKYRSIDANTLINLENHKIWFPRPCDTDDPYDCAIHIERKHITDDETKELFNLWKANKIFQEMDYKKLANNYSTNGEPNEKFKSLIEESGKFAFANEREKIIKEWGVASFSRIYNDQNMWALYSDKHRGICLEFDTKYPFFSDAVQVNYEPQIPKMSIAEMLLSNSKGCLRLMTTTKAKCWAYQKEMRVFMEPGNKGYQYDPKALTGVYFGLNTSDSDKELVIQILGKTFKEYYVIEKNEDIYKLQKKHINQQNDQSSTQLFS